MIGSSSLLADYEAKVFLYQGDPKGNRQAGTLTLVSAPTLAMKSGETGGLLVGSQVQVGQQMMPVGHEVEVIPTAVDGGGVRVRVALKFHTLASGGGGAPQLTTTKEVATATMQAGGSMRVEMGKDPKNRHWVDVTVRRLK